MSSPRFAVAPITVLLATLALVACSSNDDDTSSPPVEGDTVTNPEATPEEDGPGIDTSTFSDAVEVLVTDGVNPSDYTSASNAADVGVVREALGYASWNL